MWLPKKVLHSRNGEHTLRHRRVGHRKGRCPFASEWGCRSAWLRGVNFVGM